MTKQTSEKRHRLCSSPLPPQGDRVHRSRLFVEPTFTGPPVGVLLGLWIVFFCLFVFSYLFFCTLAEQSQLLFIMGHLSRCLAISHSQWLDLQDLKNQSTSVLPHSSCCVSRLLNSPQHRGQTGANHEISCCDRLSRSHYYTPERRFLMHNIARINAPIVGLLTR